MIGEEEFGNTLNFSGSQKCKFSFLLLGEKKELYECYDLMMLLVIHLVGVLLRRTCPVLNRNSDDVGKSVFEERGWGLGIFTLTHLGIGVIVGHVPSSGDDHGCCW